MCVCVHCVQMEMGTTTAAVDDDDDDDEGDGDRHPTSGCVG